MNRLKTHEEDIEITGKYDTNQREIVQNPLENAGKIQWRKM